MDDDCMSLWDLHSLFVGLWIGDLLEQQTEGGFWLDWLEWTIDVKNVDPKNKKNVKKRVFYEKIKKLKNVD